MLAIPVATGVDKAPLPLTSLVAGGELKLERLLATSGSSGWGRTIHISKSQSQNELPRSCLGIPWRDVVPKSSLNLWSIFVGFSFKIWPRMAFWSEEGWRLELIGGVGDSPQSSSDPTARFGLFRQGALL